MTIIPRRANTFKNTVQVDNFSDSLTMIKKKTSLSRLVKYKQENHTN
jgi:hypothetical protein